MRYPVTITPDDGQFTVTFPDVPEAVTFGETREEALQRAPDALLTIFDALIAAKRDIPAPSRRSGAAIELPALESAKIELYRAMRAGGIGKAELARRLDWHLPQVDRVLDVHHGSQIDQMEAALSAVGKKLVVQVMNAGDDIGRTVIEEAKAARVVRGARSRARTARTAGAPGALAAASLRNASSGTVASSTGAIASRRAVRRATKKR